MDEVQIKSTDLAGQDSVDSYKPTSKIDAQGHSVQKIYRRGDKIYQVKNENVTMIKNVPKSESRESNEQTDEVQSGESLYKTFAFDNVMSAEETEKCMTFWRTVVEKNLEPLKCTLIEKVSKLKAEANEKMERRKASEKKQRSKTKQSSKDKLEVELDIPTTKKNVWVEILAELQKKKLNETKLLMEKRCRFCNYERALPYETENFREENQRLINEMTKWEAKSYRKDTSKFQKKTSQNLSIQPSRGSQNRVSQLIFGDIAKIPEENVINENNIEQMLVNVKEESKKIKHIDVIEKKKQEGSYSKWRENKMELCECEKETCDCNKNPSIKTVKEPVGTRTSKTNETADEGNKTSMEQIFVAKEDNSGKNLTAESIKEDVKDMHTDESQTGKVNETIKKSCLSESPRSSTDEQKLKEVAKDDSLILPKSSLVEKDVRDSIGLEPEFKGKLKSLTVLLPCACSQEDCDCEALLTLLEKPNISKEIDLPKASRKNNLDVHKTDSLELIKRKLSNVTSKLSTQLSKDDQDVINIYESDQERKSIAGVTNSLELATRRLRSPKISINTEGDEESLTKERTVSFS